VITSCGGQRREVLGDAGCSDSRISEGWGVVSVMPSSPLSMLDTGPA
jgi:hypothetical protein